VTVQQDGSPVGTDRHGLNGDVRQRTGSAAVACFVEYTKKVESSVFEIIAEPNRRAILSLLVSSQQSVGEIARRLRMSQPTVSKHLRVLREAGFVESRVDAQRRLYRLNPEPLQEVDAWLAPFRQLWSAHVDALERHLDSMDQSTPTEKKTRRTR
jgi:DNA-binding transcriptional ArsR family regulator